MITSSPPMPSSSWLQAGKLVLNHLPAVAAGANPKESHGHTQLALNWPQPGPGILDLKDQRPWCGLLSLVILILISDSTIRSTIHCVVLVLCYLACHLGQSLFRSPAWSSRQDVLDNDGVGQRLHFAFQLAA